MALEHPGGEASDSQNVSRYVKLQEMYGKFLQEALQAPNHQRMQLIFEGLHPAIVTGISQLLREVLEQVGQYSQEEFEVIATQHDLPDKLRVLEQLCLQNSSSVLPSSVEQPAVPAMELLTRMAAKQAEKQQLMANLAQLQQEQGQLQAELVHVQAEVDGFRKKYDCAEQQLLPLQDAMQPLMEAVHAGPVGMEQD